MGLRRCRSRGPRRRALGWGQQRASERPHAGPGGPGRRGGLAAAVDGVEVGIGLAHRGVPAIAGRGAANRRGGVADFSAHLGDGLAGQGDTDTLHVQLRRRGFRGEGGDGEGGDGGGESESGEGLHGVFPTVCLSFGC